MKTHQRWIEALESVVPGNSQAAFGGGPGEKGCASSTSPAAYPTFCLGLVAQEQKPKQSNSNSASSCKKNSSSTFLRKRPFSPTREVKLHDFLGTKLLPCTMIANAQ